MTVTRDDVAKRADVSTAVVSYVLNNGPRVVSAERRARVLAAVEELGYVPDAVAKQLRSGRSDMIGLMLPDIENPFFAQLAHEIELAASARGYTVILSSSSTTQQERANLGRLEKQRVAGIVLASIAGEDHVEELQNMRTPVIAVDRSRPGSSIGSVYVDNAEGARIATDHLIAHGRRHHAIIAGPASSVVADERVAGWRSSLARAGLSADRVIHTDFTLEGGYRAARDLLRDATRPTAVLASSDVQAMGLLRAAADHGVNVPNEIAVMSFDGTELSRFQNPRLSALRQPFSAIAGSAIDRLMARDDDHQPLVMMPRLHPNESCGCTNSSTGAAD